jgi:glycosyltransferase involved in cell wall biosynthesis
VLFDLSVLKTRARVRGIGRYVADLARGFVRVRQPHDSMHVLAVEDLGWFGTSVISDDLTAALDRLERSERQTHVAWAYQLRLGLARAARAARADLVHTGHPNATPLGKCRCPRVTTCHDLIPLRFPDKYLGYRDGYRRGRQWLDFRRFHSADHVIAVSESTANDLITLLGVDSRRITVVYNGVDLRKWSSDPSAEDRAIRDRHDLCDGSYVLFVGNCDWRKNSGGMLRAISALARRRPDSTPILAWAAELDELDAARVRSQARELGIERELRLLGFVPDAELAALYRGALGSLFVSRSEGFGYPVVEAMATGCPVITSDRSSMAEIALDAAIQVNPDHGEAIADAIDALAQRSGERARLREKGVQRAAHFSLERMAEETLSVYARVLDSRRSHAA